MKYSSFMCFDVESIGLHGEGYAVGFVVVDMDGNELESGLYAVDPESTHGTSKNRQWVRDNIPEIPITHDSKQEMRDAFWQTWRKWADKGAALVADCAWPVEARFLCACVDDDPEAREWLGPYPLLDFGSVALALGADPTAAYLRKENEFPVHHPLADARQSARLLIEALRVSVPH